MIDISTHTFTTNRKGLVWLTFMTTALIGAAGVMIWVIFSRQKPITGFEETAILLTLVVLAAYAFFALYCDWKSYLFARQTMLTIDTQTFTFTYTHAGKTTTFQPTDVAHWYWDTGLFLSRVSAHHSVIVLKSGEELMIHMWLFEGNRFLMSNNPAENTFNAGYFIESVRSWMRFPAPEDAPRYKYLAK